MNNRIIMQASVKYSLSEHLSTHGIIVVATDAGTVALLVVASAVAAVLQPATQSSRLSETRSLSLSLIS